MPRNAGGATRYLGEGPSLWAGSVCHEACPLYHECFGTSAAAPCACPEGAERPEECPRAGTICRVCGDAAAEDPLEGVPLACLEGTRWPEAPSGLPLVLPEATSRLPPGTRLQLRWVVAGLRDLVSEGGLNRAPVVKRGVRAGRACLREAMRVASSTRLLAVLNRKDEPLERFWGMDRWALWAALGACGVELVTGPTFSVVEETAGQTAFHNLLMLRRHHLTCRELASAGLAVAPNLYWRGDRELSVWVTFLQKHTGLSSVSREFAAIRRDPAGFREDAAHLVRLLREVARPLHVVLLGVGHRHAPWLLPRLTELGCSASLVTSRPAVLAMRHLAFVLDGGDLREEPSDLDRVTLFQHNLALMELLIRRIGGGGPSASGTGVAAAAGPPRNRDPGLRRPGT